MRLILIIFFLQVFGALHKISGQDCQQQDIHLRECEVPNNKEFKNTDKTRTYTFNRGKVNKLEFPLFSEKEYFLRVCPEDNSKVNIKIKDANTRELLFDNKWILDIAGALTFQLELSRMILIEISFPKVEENRNPAPSNKVCTGFLLYQKTIKL